MKKAISSELKALALDILDYPLDMRDTLFPHAHTVPLYKQIIKFENYNCTNPGWYNNSDTYVEELTKNNQKPTNIAVIEIKEKSFHLTCKTPSLIINLTDIPLYVLVSEDKHRLDLAYDIPDRELFDYSRNKITENKIIEDHSILIGNRFFHQIQGETGAKLLYVRYN
jgi:hypothetical protein